MLPQKYCLRTFLVTVFSLACLISFAQIQITYPLNRMVFQRNTGNSASVSITGQYQQSIDRVDARVVSIQGGTTSSWQTIQNTPQGGFFSGILNVIGGWYQLEVRGMLNGTAVANTTLQKFGVGEVFVVSGQSNARGYYNFGASGASDDRVNAVDFYDTEGGNELPQPNFIHLDANVALSPHGESAWCWGRLGDLIASRYNVPVMFYNTSFDGTSVGNWAETVDGGTTKSAYGTYQPGQPFIFLKKALNYYASMTGARAVLWHQGESDTQLSTTTTAYKNYLQTVISKSRQYYGNNIGWVVARASYIRGFTSNDVLSGQQQTISSTPNTFAGPYTDNIQIPRPNYDIHFQNEGLNDLGNAWNAALDQYFFDNCTPISGAYPTFSASCGTNSLNLSVQGMSSVRWSNGSNTSSTSLNADGSYQALAKDGAGNAYSIPYLAIPRDIADKPTISVQGSLQLCQGGSVGLQSSATSGNTWSNGATNQQINVTNPGTYTVSAKNKYGCTAISSAVTVTSSPLPPPTSPTISSSSSGSVCEGNQTTLTASGNTSFAWSTGETTKSITVKTSNTYSVRAIDAQGCASTPASINIQVSPPPPVPTIASSSAIEFCEGGQVTLTSSALTGNTWSNGATTQSITVNTSGNYSVQVKDANNCVSSSNPVAVIVNPKPAKPTITAQKPTNFCSDDNTVLVSSTENQYRWSNGQTGQSITVNNSGSFSLTVTSNKGCTSTVSDAVTTNVYPSPSAPTITANKALSICANDNITLTSTSQQNYAWSNGQTSKSISVNQAGNYWVKAVDNNGCYSPASNIILLNVNPLPEKPVITASRSTSLCQGEQVTLSSNYNSNIVWNTSQTSSQINVSTPGQFSLKYKNSNGCESVSDVVNVEVNAPPAAPTINNLLPTTFCQNDNTVLAIPLSSDEYLFNWSTGDNSPQITVSNATTITATITNKATGCTSAASKPVSTRINPLPATPIITANRTPVICENESVVLSSNTQLNYLWSNGVTTATNTVKQNGDYYVRAIDANKCLSLPSNIINLVVNPLPAKPIISLSGSSAICQGQKLGMEASYSSGLTWSTSESTQKINVSNTGSYTVKYKDSNGCEAISDPTVINVNPLPDAPKIQNERPTVFCQNDSTILNIALSSSQYNFNWSDGQKSQKISVKNAGPITATVTNPATGCVSPVSDPVNITVNPIPAQPTISSNGNTTFCADQSIVLAASEPTAISYEWNSKEITSTLTVNKEGSYAVKVKNKFGCSSISSQPISVKVNQLPQVPNVIAETPLELCEGDKASLRVDSPNEVIWNTNDASNHITVNKTGAYKARVKDLNGCLSPFSAEIDINIKPLPLTPSIEKIGFYTLGAIGSNENGIYTWTINGKIYDDTRMEIKAKQAGEYQVQVAVKYSSSLTCFSKISPKFQFVPETGNDKLGIYPNPSTGIVTVETLDDLKDVSLNVYTADGRYIKSILIPLINERKKLDLSSLQPGTYIVELISTNYHSSKKLIISQ